MFGTGEWVIDTKREIVSTVCAVIAESVPRIYVLKETDGVYYIEDESNLIEYDKYWFDRK